MARLRVTVVAEYDADPESYGTSNPLHMAKIDQASWEQEPDYLVDMLIEQGTIKVEPA